MKFFQNGCIVDNFPATRKPNSIDNYVLGYKAAWATGTIATSILVVMMKSTNVLDNLGLLYFARALLILPYVISLLVSLAILVKYSQEKKQNTSHPLDGHAAMIMVVLLLGVAGAITCAFLNLLTADTNTQEHMALFIAIPIILSMGSTSTLIGQHSSENYPNVLQDHTSPFSCN